MHSDFADWYRAAGIDPPAGLLTARWTGVNTVAEAADVVDVLTAAKLFVLGQSSDTDVPAKFRAPFKDADEAFPGRGNIMEMRLLAGAILRIIIEKQTQLSTIAALALICGSFGSRKSNLPEPSHVTAAITYILDAGKAARVITSIELEGAFPRFDQSRIAELVTPALFPHPNTANLHGPLTSILSELSSTINAISKSSKQAIAELVHQLSIRDEEIEALWWLQTAFSTSMNSSFSELGPKIGVMVIPTDLSILTKILPGLPSAPAMMCQALQVAGAKVMTERVTLSEVINATPVTWRQATVGQQDLTMIGSLCPILLACKRSLDAPDGDYWQAVYKNVCDISLQDAEEIIEVAAQVYFEWQLVRAVS